MTTPAVIVLAMLASPAESPREAFMRDCLRQCRGTRETSACVWSCSYYVDHPWSLVGSDATVGPWDRWGTK